MNRQIKLWQLILVAVTLMIATLVSMVLVQKRTIHRLNESIHEIKIQNIISQDSIADSYYLMMLDKLNRQDTIVANSIDRLIKEQTKLSKQYENINSSYSDIVIERPIY